MIRKINLLVVGVVSFGVVLLLGCNPAKWNTRFLRSQPVVTKYQQAVFHPQQESTEDLIKDSVAGKDTVFLLGIFSHDKDGKQAAIRSMIRNTYLSYSDTMICSLVNYMHYKDSNTPHDCKVLYSFVIGAANDSEDSPTDHFRTDRPIVVKDYTPKNADDNDCTYLNIQENMNYGKTPTWFKYASSVAESYGIDYIAKVDSDTMVSMKHLVDFITTDLPPYPYNVRTYGGSMVHHAKRSKRGNLYAFGQFSFFSRDMASYISSDDLDRYQIKQDGNGFNRGWAEKTIAEDMDTAELVWTHPYPLKIIFMNSRVPWVHRIKTEKSWMDIWDETHGIGPVSRIVGHFEHSVKAGDWTKHLQKQEEGSS